MSQTALPVRPPAVAGYFYPAEPARLRGQVEAMLEQARADLASAGDDRGAGDGRVGTSPSGLAALIVPHAGYVYSGPTAARAWALAGSLRGRLERVVMLGPTHRVGVRAMALPGCRAMDTPLGAVEVEVPPQLAALEEEGLVVTRPDVHAEEHCLEVQLPFLSTVLPGVPVVPLAVGRVSPAQAAQAVRLFLGDPGSLVVVSSDLSHYLPLARARQVDAGTVARILALDPDVTHAQACGATSVNALLLAARERHLEAELLGTATSADTIGSPERVVGYCAVALRSRDADGAGR